MATSTESREEMKVFTLDAGQHSLGWLYIIIIYVLGNSQNTYRAEIIATTLQYIHRSEEYKESVQDIQTSSWRKITLQEVAEMVAWVKHSPCAGGANSWLYQIGQLEERENYKHIYISVSEYDPGWLRYMQEVQVVPLYFACWICLHAAKRYMEYYICIRIGEIRLEIYRPFIDSASRRCMFDPTLWRSLEHRPSTIHASIQQPNNLHLLIQTLPQHIRPIYSQRTIQITKIAP